MNVKRLLKKYKIQRRKKVNEKIKALYEYLEEELVSSRECALINIYEFDECIYFRNFEDLTKRYIGRYKKDYIKKEHYINGGGYLVYKLTYKI